MSCANPRSADLARRYMISGKTTSWKTPRPKLRQLRMNTFTNHNNCKVVDIIVSPPYEDCRPHEFDQARFHPSPRPRPPQPFQRHDLSPAQKWRRGRRAARPDPELSGDGRGPRLHGGAVGSYLLVSLRLLGVCLVGARRVWISRCGLSSKARPLHVPC